MTAANEECIHGFEAGMCASCFPPAPPPTPAPVKRPARVAPSSLRSPAPGATGRAAEVRGPNLPQRIFHVTHVDNLAAILASGELRASSMAEPEVRLASDLALELRATAPVPLAEPLAEPLAVDAGASAPGVVSVADCVAFSLTPQATWWLQVQEGAAGPTWSAAARSASTTDFVVLGVDVAAVAPRLIVSDGDAAAPATRFGSGAEGRVRMLSRAVAAPEFLQVAEALVPGTVSLDLVALVAVANDRRRDEVRGMLQSAGLAAKVVVYPPWFVPLVER